jgi:hypothetical protein
MDNSKGIILVLIAMATFSVHDAIIKFIFTEAALYEIYFGRTFIAALLSAAYLLLTKQKIILKTSYPILSIVRVVLHFLAFSFYSFLLLFLIFSVFSFGFFLIFLCFFVLLCLSWDTFFVDLGEKSCSWDFLTAGIYFQGP